MPDEERPMPALWGYVDKVYRKMEDTAEAEDDDLVYTGHLTGLFQELGIPNPYYTSVMAALKAMGCVLQLRRGGGTSRSKWQLVTPPTEELFLANVAKGSGVGISKQHSSRLTIAEQALRDLSKRVLRLEDALQETLEPGT